jgi:CubicO group peptidase (beta-lactamase class C family)
MTPTALPVLAAGVLVAAFAIADSSERAQASGRAGASSRQSAGFDAIRLARVDQFIERHVAEKRLPGAVLLLARRGHVAALKTFGLADAETRRPMTTDSLFRASRER